jgi:hypothetical protein
LRAALPGGDVEFKWSLDRPEASWGAVASASLPMQHAWDAAVVAFKEFINAIINGELIASGMPPATGVRCDLEPSEWTRSDQVLDVLNGDLIDVRYGNHVRRWSNINLRAAKRPRQKTTRWHGYDWDGAWAYALTLRAEDQWDWKKHRRDKKQRCRRFAELSRTRSWNGSRRGAVFQISATFAEPLRSRSIRAGSLGASASVESALVARGSHYQPP